MDLKHTDKSSISSEPDERKVFVPEKRTDVWGSELWEAGGKLHRNGKPAKIQKNKALVSNGPLA